MYGMNKKDTTPLVTEKETLGYVVEHAVHYPSGNSCKTAAYSVWKKPFSPILKDAGSDRATYLHSGRQYI